MRRWEREERKENAARLLLTACSALHDAEKYLDHNKRHKRAITDLWLKAWGLRDRVLGKGKNNG